MKEKYNDIFVSFKQPTTVTKVKISVPIDEKFHFVSAVFRQESAIGFLDGNVVDISKPFVKDWDGVYDYALQVLGTNLQTPDNELYVTLGEISLYTGAKTAGFIRALYRLYSI